MIIVLDTNIFYASSFRDPSFTALFDLLSRSREVSLHIPQLVIDELTNKFKETIDEMEHDLKRLLRAYHRWTGEWLSSPLADDKAISAIVAYEHTLKDDLRRVGATIHSYPTISHEQLVAKCLARKKPFSEDGRKGYRDALIWASILEILINYTTEEVTFITNNSNDFFERDRHQLHLHLTEDLHRHNIDVSRIKVFNDLHSFIDAYVKPTMEMLEARDQESIRSDLSLGLGRFDKEGIERAILRALLSYNYSDEISPHTVGLPAEVETITVSNVEDLFDLHIRDARKLSSGEWFVEATTIVIYQFDFYASKADWYTRRMDKDPFVYMGWGDSHISAQAVRPVQVTLTVTFDEPNGTVTSIEVNSFAFPFDIETMTHLIGRSRMFCIANPI